MIKHCFEPVSKVAIIIANLIDNIKMYITIAWSVITTEFELQARRNALVVEHYGNTLNTSPVV